MTDKPDLANPDEIKKLLLIFYARVRADDLLSPVFVDQVDIDWDLHIPKITAFWSKLELGIPGYQGLPTQKHAELSAVQPFRAEQFERWVRLFQKTIDERWSGPHANAMKARAELIAVAQSRAVPTAEQWAGFEDGQRPSA